MNGQTSAHTWLPPAEILISDLNRKNVKTFRKEKKNPHQKEDRGKILPAGRSIRFYLFAISSIPYLLSEHTHARTHTYKVNIKMPVYQVHPPSTCPITDSRPSITVLNASCPETQVKVKKKKAFQFKVCERQTLLRANVIVCLKKVFNKLTCVQFYFIFISSLLLFVLQPIFTFART